MFYPVFLSFLVIRQRIDCLDFQEIACTVNLEQLYYLVVLSIEEPFLPAPRKPPPSWWLLGYLAQYQPQALLLTLAKEGLPPDSVYQAATKTAENLPTQSYRRLSKTWAVRRLRFRKELPME